MGTFLPSFALIGTYSAEGDTPIGMTISPRDSYVPEGATLQFVAYLTYPDGSISVLRSGVAWSSSTPESATIDASSGLATGINAGGHTTITAVYGALTATTPLGVSPIALTIYPANPLVNSGDTQQFVVYGTWPDSTTSILTSGATWSSSNTSTVTIDPNTGLATAVEAGGGGSTITVAYGYLTATTQMNVTGMETRIPTLVDSEGDGVAWASPSSATGSGFGTSQSVGIPSFSISNGVATLNTTYNSFVAGQPVTINYTLTAMDGQTFLVNAAGLSSTSFTVNTTAADKALTYGGASAVPVTSYASAGRYDGIVPAPNQYVATVQGGSAPFAQTGTGGHPSFAGFLPVNLVVEGINGAYGINGTPLGPNNVSTTSVSVAPPSLPAGATVVGVYAHLYGQTFGSGAYNGYSVHWGSGSHSGFALNVPSTNSGTLVYLGTDPSVISTAYFVNQLLSSLEAGPPGYSFSTAIKFYGFQVVYTLPSGSGTTPGQIQNLTSKQFAFTLPPSSTVSGVQVQFTSGVSDGTEPITLVVQLTVHGNPVGTPKTQLLSNWNTNYTFGDSTDMWGITSLTDADVNDVSSPPSSGLGVIVSAVLPDQSQINLNGIEATVWFH